MNPVGDYLKLLWENNIGYLNICETYRLVLRNDIYIHIPMKLCIFVKGAQNRGKSSTILELANELGIPDNEGRCGKGNSEIEIIRNWNGVNVGLRSKGDPGCDSLDWIKDTAINEKNCEIIVAACRRGGSTQDPILPYLKEKGYAIVEVYPSMIKLPDNSQADYKTLAQALAHQILFLMDNYQQLLH